jgi:hypothetical protein
MKRLNNWISNSYIRAVKLKNLHQELREKSVLLNKIKYNSFLYGYKDTNISWWSCLMLEINSDNVRQIILYPDGKLFYDWRYKGSIFFSK